MEQQAPAQASDNDVYANPPDVSELELEPGHPGLGDEGYIARRRELFAILPRCTASRHQPPPLIDYTDEEQRIWREVTPKLDELHAQHASAIYLHGEARAAISEQRDPATAPPERAPARGERDAPGPGRGADPVPHLLLLHRRPRLPRARSSSATARSRSSRPSRT